MIKMIVDASYAQNCKYVSVGTGGYQIGGDIFLQMGVDALSVVPACILPVRKALRAVYITRNVILSLSHCIKSVHVCRNIAGDNYKINENFPGIQIQIGWHMFENME